MGVFGFWGGNDLYWQVILFPVETKISYHWNSLSFTNREWDFPKAIFLYDLTN